MIREFQFLLDSVSNIVFLTGAGISTNSGLPDFRGDDGFWKTNKPIFFKDFVTSSSKRRDSWKRNLALHHKLSEIKPNDGHHFVKRVLDQKEGIVITQNIDALHEKSGILKEKIRPSSRISPLLNARIKIMSNLDIAERRIPQDGRMSLKLGERWVDIRVSTLPSSYGERIVLRLLDKADSSLDLKELGMTENLLRNYKTELKNNIQISKTLEFESDRRTFGIKLLQISQILFW